MSWSQVDRLLILFLIIRIIITIIIMDLEEEPDRGEKENPYLSNNTVQSCGLIYPELLQPDNI